MNNGFKGLKFLTIARGKDRDNQGWGERSGQTWEISGMWFKRFVRAEKDSKPQGEVAD